MCFHFKQSKSKKEFEANGIKGEPINGVYNGFSHPKVSSLSLLVVPPVLKGGCIYNDNQQVN